MEDWQPLNHTYDFGGGGISPNYRHVSCKPPLLFLVASSLRGFLLRFIEQRKHVVSVNSAALLLLPPSALTRSSAGAGIGSPWKNSALCLSAQPLRQTSMFGAVNALFYSSLCRNCTSII